MGVTTTSIGAVGSSFGSMVVLGARDPRVRALALMATPCEITPEPSPQGESSETVTLESGARVKRAFYEDTARHDLVAAVREYARPTLLVHGSEDEVVPVEDAVRLHDAAREPRRLMIIPGADHSFSDPERRRVALALCVEWMREHVR
jgi:putative redox protein